VKSPDYTSELRKHELDVAGAFGTFTDKSTEIKNYFKMRFFATLRMTMKIWV